jgi:polyisoprenoid-binding protein YceI
MPMFLAVSAPPPPAVRGVANDRGVESATLALDPAASSLTFTIRRPGESIDGTAHEFAGEVVLDPANLSQGASVVLRVTAASIETGNRLRDGKMRRSHLEVERFPEIVFRSSSIQVGPERDRSAPGAPAAGTSRKALVEGTLGLHGVEHGLLVPAAIRYDNGTLTAEGSVALTYSDYGIPIPRFLWLVMDDDITVRFRFVAKAAAQ